MAIDGSTQQDIGRLQGVAQSLKEQMEIIREENAELRRDLAEIKTLIAQIKGGSRVLFFLGSLAGGGVGAAVVKWLPILLAK